MMHSELFMLLLQPFMFSWWQNSSSSAFAS